MGELRNIIYDNTTDIWYLIPIITHGNSSLNKFIMDNKEVIFIGDRRSIPQQKEDLIELILMGGEYTKYYTKILVTLMSK